MSTPAELWLQHQTDVAELNGELLHAAVRLEIDKPATLTIRRASANPERPQGLVLDSDEPLTIGDTTTPRLVLWSDTALAEVSLAVPPGRITFSHAWRDADIVHAWTGWAGIVRHDDPDDPSHIRLTASDGHGSVTADLEVDIHLTTD